MRNLATNPYQSVVKLPGIGLKADGIDFGVERKDGAEIGSDARMRILGGLDVVETAGPTAVTFERMERDRSCNYVTTTGGLVSPVGEWPGIARVVRGDVGVIRDGVG